MFRKDKAKWVRIGVLVMATALLLGACSSDNGGSSSQTTDTSSEAGYDPSGVLRLGYNMQQPAGTDLTIDPVVPQSNAPVNDPIWYLVYARLLRPEADGSFTPDLAESTKVVDTGTIEVDLRPGLTFSDGTPLTADTVKSQFESIVANKEKFSAAYPAPFFDLTSVTVTSPTAFTLSIANGKAASWHDAYLPSWTSSIMKPGSPENKPIGAGPFAFTDVRPGESWTLQKNQSYWDAGSIKLGGVELTHTVVDQPQAALNALQAGQIDATSSLEPSQIPALTGDLKAATTVSPNTSINMHICKSEGPLADARVRKAVNKAIDRDAINDAIYNGAGEPAIQYWPEGHRFFSDELQDLAYDPDGAKQLLQEAGYGNGVDLDMYVIPAFSLPDIAQVLQSQLKEVGINVSIIQAPDYTNQYIVPKKPALGLYPSSQVGAEKLNSVSGSSIGNICGYSDPNLDSVVKQLQGVSVASDQAVQLWDQANSLIVGDALMGFILFRPVISAYDSATVGDMSPLVAANYYVPDPRVTYIKQK